MPTLILTGATRGIGQAGAIELAGRGAELGVVGRDAARVRATAEEARASGGGAPVHEHVADLERMDEVRRLAVKLLEAYPRIDVLANNAGAMFTSRHVTADGFEQTFALNHLAPFLLTNLLLERLAA
jgi:NAD(P)-dependent dehydrogenase (short-subunit alcohol dehydrogenase family)